MLSPYFMANDPLIQFAGAFLLIFAIVFGTVKLTNLGKDKSAATLVSVAIALFASLNQSVVMFIWQIMPYAAVILVFLFLFILIKNNLGIGKDKDSQSPSRDTMISVIVLFFLLLLLYIFYQGGMLSFISPDMEENVMWGIGILIVILILILGTKHSGTENG